MRPAGMISETIDEQVVHSLVSTGGAGDVLKRWNGRKRRRRRRRRRRNNKKKEKKWNEEEREREKKDQSHSRRSSEKIQV